MAGKKAMELANQFYLVNDCWNRGNETGGNLQAVREVEARYGWWRNKNVHPRTQEETTATVWGTINSLIVWGLISTFLWEIHGKIIAFSVLTLLVGRQEGPVKNWVVGCWHGYLSGARCRFAYGPADATATCLSKIQIGITFLVLGYGTVGFTFLVLGYGTGLPR